MSTDRTLDQVLNDAERWAQHRLRAGDDFVYLTSDLVTEGVAPIPIKTEMPKAKLVTKSDVARTPTLPVVASQDWESATDLLTLKSMIENCTKCALHQTRTKFVFGVGNPHAKVMVIGEAPGADEDKKGEPFVGRGGQLLDKMLLAIDFPREEVFIANILKSRPPGNRDPQADEIAACEPYLWKQIDIIRPKMILCMGRVAGVNLLKNGISTLKDLRGNVYDFRGAKVMVTYHPAALLRNPNWKHGAWEDLQKFRKLYDEMVSDETGGTG